jgi:4-phytase/acid phosphatase
LKLDGPLGVGATLAENVLLEYAQGMPLADVAWGVRDPQEFLRSVMPAHERIALLGRRNPYIASRRGLVMARAILAALTRTPSPYFPSEAKIIAFAGHDTNLSNMAGVFGLDWTLPDQPDSTAPATTLAFELWSDAKTGDKVVRPVLFYETLQQLRTLAPPRASRVALKFSGCGGEGDCPLATLLRFVGPRLPTDCPDQSPTDVKKTASVRSPNDQGGQATLDPR